MAGTNLQAYLTGESTILFEELAGPAVPLLWQRIVMSGWEVNSTSSRLRCTSGVGKRGQDWGYRTQLCSSDTIKEAAKVTEIVAAEVELSLWSISSFRDRIAKACAELNIPIYAKVDLESKAFSG